MSGRADTVGCIHRKEWALVQTDEDSEEEGWVLPYQLFNGMRVHEKIPAAW
jgi:hypothetical protein